MSDAAPARNNKRLILWMAAGAALCVALVLGGRHWGAETSGENDVAPAQAAETPIRGRMVEFPVVESSGKATSTKDLLGRVVVADFMFTSCQATCPRLTSEMKSLADALVGADDVRFVSFSVDPDRDAPGILAKYAKDHGCDPSRWIYLRSDPSDLKKLMCAQLHLANPNEAMLHSDRFVLFDADGVARGFYRPLDGVEPEWKSRLLADVARLRTSAH